MEPPDLVPDVAGEGVDEDGGEPGVPLYPLLLLVHHTKHNVT